MTKQEKGRVYNKIQHLRMFIKTGIHIMIAGLLSHNEFAIPIGLKKRFFLTHSTIIINLHIQNISIGL